MEENTVIEEQAKEQERKEPTNEELKYWLDKAISDNKQIMARFRELTNIFNILPYLFKVVELEDKFEPEFVTNCKDTIKALFNNEMEAETKEEV